MRMSHPRRVSQPLVSRIALVIHNRAFYPSAAPKPRSTTISLHTVLYGQERDNHSPEETDRPRVTKPQRSLGPFTPILDSDFLPAASRLPASDPPSPAARRSASLHKRLSFTTYRDSPLVLSIKTPLPGLVPPSKFSSPFTPANQVPHTPFHPPELYKGTPSKRDRNRHWQWSPVLGPRLRSRGVDENVSPVHTPDTADDSPICDLTRRFSLIAPPSKHVPRRLSYSHRDASVSPFTPEQRHGQALASPVFIRSSLWSPSPATSPRYQLDELNFSPFHIASF